MISLHFGRVGTVDQYTSLILFVLVWVYEKESVFVDVFCMDVLL